MTSVLKISLKLILLLIIGYCLCWFLFLPKEIRQQVALECFGQRRYFTQSTKNIEDIRITSVVKFQATLLPYQRIIGSDALNIYNNNYRNGLNNFFNPSIYQYFF